MNTMKEGYRRLSGNSCIPAILSRPRKGSEAEEEEEEEDPDIAKIKKVQSFFRGWLCRSGPA